MRHVVFALQNTYRHVHRDARFHHRRFRHSRGYDPGFDQIDHAFVGIIRGNHRVLIACFFQCLCGHFGSHRRAVDDVHIVVGLQRILNQLELDAFAGVAVFRLKQFNAAAFQAALNTRC